MFDIKKERMNKYRANFLCLNVEYLLFHKPTKILSCHYVVEKSDMPNHYLILLIGFNLDTVSKPFKAQQSPSCACWYWGIKKRLPYFFFVLWIHELSAELHRAAGCLILKPNPQRFHEQLSLFSQARLSPALPSEHLHKRE